MKIIFVLFVCLLAGCGEDSKKNLNNTEIRPERDATGDSNESQDTGIDSSRSDAGADISNGDAEEDLPFVPGECGKGVYMDTITVDADGPAGQLHSRAVWDGNGAWIVYNRRDQPGESAESIFLSRVGCDGALSFGPQKVSEGDERHYMPVIDTDNGTSFVLWVEQRQGDSPDTLKLKTFDVLGAPITQVAVDVTPSLPGGVRPTLIWEPDIVAISDNEAVVIASAAVGNDFQVIVQRFDSTGAKLGEAIIPARDVGVRQIRPSIGKDAVGNLLISWIRTANETNTAVMTTIPIGATEAVPASPPPAKPLGGENEIARYAKELSSTDDAFFVFQERPGNSADIIVRSADLSSTASVTLGTPNFVNFRPSVAGGDGGGAAAWFRYDESPQRNEVVVQRFGFAAGAFTTFAPIVVGTDSPAIPPYGPGITHVGGDDYFVVWSEGASGGQTRVKAKFLRITAP